MMVTVEEAMELACPLTMPRPRKETQNCMGPNCMVWRFKDHPTDAAWIDAVRRAAEELNDRSPSRTKAATHVMRNRAKYGLPETPERGWCGLAGKPEWWPKKQGDV